MGLRESGAIYATFNEPGAPENSLSSNGKPEKASS